MKLLLATLMGSLLLGASPTALQAAPVTLKIATVMPRGGPWAKAMSRFANAVKRRTKNQVRFRFYFGAVAGTDQRAIARMKSGQIQGIAAASVTLTQLENTFRVLELPMLYRSYKEFWFVQRSMTPIFKKRFKAKGYRALAMASVGWVYLYSKREIRNLTDARKCKVWHWQRDPVATTLFKAVGVRGNPLPVTDVLASLQAGTIDTVYGMANSTQALQWNTAVKYYLDLKILMAIATIVVRNDAFEKLTEAQQKIVIEESLKMQRYLNKASKKINAKALRTMRKSGLKRLKPSKAFLKQLNAIRRKVWGKLKNKLYKPADLKKIKALLTLCRNTSCSS